MKIRAKTQRLTPGKERVIGRLTREQAEKLGAERRRVAAAESDTGKLPWETDEQHQDRLAGRNVYTTEDAERSAAAAEQAEREAQKADQRRRISELLEDIDRP